MTEPPWLEAPRRQLLAMRPRLPHAVLVQGPAGWGQERLAGVVALELLGLDPNRVAAEVAHPDLRWLAPEGGAIRVDAVRALAEFLVQTPQLAVRKVAVLAAAERMNANAANALLKTLEEPPAESFVIACTGQAGRLLATIRSRCQRIEVRPGAPADVLAWLAAAGADAEQAGYLAVEYGGAPFAALAALESGQAPLWPALSAAGRDASGTGALAEERKDEELADLAGRWLCILHWQLRRVAGREEAVRALLGFAADLALVRQMASLNPALNKPLQLRRLLLRWRELWPLLPPVPPRLEGLG